MTVLKMCQTHTQIDPHHLPLKLLDSAVKCMELLVCFLVLCSENQTWMKFNSLFRIDSEKCWHFFLPFVLLILGSVTTHYHLHQRAGNTMWEAMGLKFLTPGWLYHINRYQRLRDGPVSSFSLIIIKYITWFM